MGKPAHKTRGSEGYSSLALARDEVHRMPTSFHQTRKPSGVTPRCAGGGGRQTASPSEGSLGVSTSASALTLDLATHFGDFYR